MGLTFVLLRSIADVADGFGQECLLSHLYPCLKNCNGHHMLRLAIVLKKNVSSSHIGLFIGFQMGNVLSSIAKHNILP